MAGFYAPYQILQTTKRAVMKILTSSRHTLIGVVQKGGQVRTFDKGNAVANFSVMTQGFTNKSDGSSERTVQFHNVQVWNATFDDLYSLIEEGAYVMIIGPMQSYEFKDKKSGDRREFVYTKGMEVSLITKVTDL